MKGGENIMHGKISMTITGLDDSVSPIEFNMDNETEKEFFYKMQDFLLNKGLKISIYPETKMTRIDM